MPIDSTHKQYAAALPQWQKIRTALDGKDAVKLKAEEYVPKPRGFENNDTLWQEYLWRGEWFPAASRTVVGLLGAMFRRSPVVELPNSYETYKTSITQSGLSIEGFSKFCSKELIEIGRFGILVDMPAQQDNNPATIKSRPYLAGYCAEQIINWRETTIEDPQNPGLFLRLPTLVVLKECETVEDGDKYTLKEVEQIRVLHIDSNNIYTVEVWQKLEVTKGNTKQEWILISATQPKGPTGKPLSFIPFVFVGPENLQSEVERSPIADLVDINLSHFFTALDLEWACHLTACPMVYVTGFEDKTRTFSVGSAVVWQFENPEVKLAILEYQGAGIEALENRAKIKEDKMAKLGANLLRTKNKQPETAETTRIEHSAESSILSMIARNSSAAITLALGWAVWWASGLEADAKKTSVEQNTEFYDARLTYQELDSFTKALQAGTMPVSVYCFNLIRGDMVKAGTTQEELEVEVEESLENPRAMGGFGSSFTSNQLGQLGGAPKQKEPAKKSPADKKQAPGQPAGA